MASRSALCMSTVGQEKSAKQTTTKKTTCIEGADGPIVVVSALLKLAHWCQQCKHSDSGGNPCDTSGKTLSPPAPIASQSAHPVERTLDNIAAVEATGGATDSRPTGDSKPRNAGRAKGGAR